MMRDDIQTALKAALKGGNAKELSTLRLITAALKDRDIAARSKGNNDGISDDEILSMLQTMIKQRQNHQKCIAMAAGKSWRNQKKKRSW